MQESELFSFLSLSLIIIQLGVKWHYKSLTDLMSNIKAWRRTNYIITSSIKNPHPYTTYILNKTLTNVPYPKRLVQTSEQTQEF